MSTSRILSSLKRSFRLFLLLDLVEECNEAIRIMRFPLYLLQRGSRRIEGNQLNTASVCKVTFDAHAMEEKTCRLAWRDVYQMGVPSNEGVSHLPIGWQPIAIRPGVSTGIAFGPSLSLPHPSKAPVPWPVQSPAWNQNALHPAKCSTAIPAVSATGMLSSFSLLKS